MGCKELWHKHCVYIHTSDCLQAKFLTKLKNTSNLTSLYSTTVFITQPIGFSILQRYRKLNQQTMRSYIQICIMSSSFTFTESEIPKIKHTCVIWLLVFCVCYVVINIQTTENQVSNSGLDSYFMLILCLLWIICRHPTADTSGDIYIRP